MLPDRRRYHSIHQNFFHNFWDDDAITDYFNSESWNDYYPSVNIIENENEFKIELAVPGLDKNHFDIKIKNNTLEISAQKEVDHEKKDKDGKKYLRREFGYTAFRRMFTLPQDAQTDQIKASYENGVLDVTIPRKKEVDKSATTIISIE